MARLIDDADIDRIYRQYVKVNDCPEYLGRYVPLPMERQTDAWPWAGKDFGRVVANLEFQRLVSQYGIPHARLLIVNGGGGDPEAMHLQPASTIEIDYDGTQDWDLHTLYGLGMAEFDLILLGHTLEHVYHPILALENLLTHLTPGGHLFASVPAITFPHSTPAHHYMGFTPVGLGCVCYAAGFEIVHVGQWGNSQYVQLMYQTRAWPDYVMLGDHIYNEWQTPAHAWVLARRPV